MPVGLSEVFAPSSSTRALSIHTEGAGFATAPRNVGRESTGSKMDWWLRGLAVAERRDARLHSHAKSVQRLTPLVIRQPRDSTTRDGNRCSTTEPDGSRRTPLANKTWHRSNDWVVAATFDQKGSFSVFTNSSFTPKLIF